MLDRPDPDTDSPTRRANVPPQSAVVAAAHERAFAVTDRLAVHGADCVCPRCAGRLPGLLGELAQALASAERSGR